MSKIKSILCASVLMLAAGTASAVPLGIDIGATAGVSASGTWYLANTNGGPTNTSDTFDVYGGGLFNPPVSYSEVIDIVPGSYSWSITGNGSGFLAGLAAWTLTINNQIVHAGGDGGKGLYFRFDINDRGQFQAVSEPGTLVLFGIGLLGLALTMNRRRNRSTM